MAVSTLYHALSPYAFVTYQVAPSDTANGESAPNDTATLEYMQATFTDHYNGNRQPFGLYTHPIHLSVRVITIANLILFVNPAIRRRLIPVFHPRTLRSK
jgi:hypothetical protein